MKCPNCGHWNRASFPRCFQCGAELPKSGEAENNGARPEMPKGGASKIYIQINEEGKATSSEDSRDQLAREMEDLLQRKKRGEAEQRRLRENSAVQGFAPSFRTAQTMTGRKTFPMPQNTSYTQNGMEVEGNVRPDAIPVVSQRIIGYDETAAPEPGMQVSESYRSKRAGKRMRPYRHSFLRRFGKLAAIMLAAARQLGFPE